jgi:MoaA/NifB/PqqE/SkfB family radical SAM enzyme
MPWEFHQQPWPGVITLDMRRRANDDCSNLEQHMMLMRKTPSRDPSWYNTVSGAPRGYIQPHTLDELWFHTGTACNLECPFCLEGSMPGDNRLDRIVLTDVQPFMDEAVSLGVRQFSFTGGEPFIVKDFVNILQYAASLRPCLVLTNGTDPVLKRLHHIERLIGSAHPVSFRVSIDYADRERHDEGRGIGNFNKSIKGLQSLHGMGFSVSVARQKEVGEDSQQVDRQFKALLRDNGLPDDLRIISFPDFDVPGSKRHVPEITEDCMTRYQSEASRRDFMCAFSKMIVKQNGLMRVYACTLVDDDPDYDLGPCLRDAQSERIMMRHHRCYTCFAFGSSCSEL